MRVQVGRGGELRLSGERRKRPDTVMTEAAKEEGQWNTGRT